MWHDGVGLVLGDAVGGRWWRDNRWGRGWVRCSSLMAMIGCALLLKWLFVPPCAHLASPRKHYLLRVWLPLPMGSYSLCFIILVAPPSNLTNITRGSQLVGFSEQPLCRGGRCRVARWGCVFNKLVVGWWYGGRILTTSESDLSWVKRRVVRSRTRQQSKGVFTNPVKEVHAGRGGWMTECARRVFHIMLYNVRTKQNGKLVTTKLVIPEIELV